MTRYGINPSYCNTYSRLPLFADPLRRGKAFEVFQESGTPTGEPSPLGPDGWPVEDGRWHGVRVYGDGDGFLPKLLTRDARVTVRQRDGFMSVAFWKDKPRGLDSMYAESEQIIGEWNADSLEAIAYFKPKILRTLDWGWQARKEKRPDWTKPRVKPSDPLQGEEMALELQIDAANKLGCHLWWNAPPRFELSVPEYEKRLEEMLEIIRDQTVKPPILEYGNELWNEGFPVHSWLRSMSMAAAHPDTRTTWHAWAAYEIHTLFDVAQRVFGEGDILGQRPYWLFVGGHIAVHDTLDRILEALSFTPDIAGPALYVTPFRGVGRDDAKAWSASAYVPTQDELMDSMFGMFPALRLKLDAHRNILKAHGVPFFGVYEAGQSLISQGRPWKKTACEVQRSERMGTLYQMIRQTLSDAKVDVACWYSACTDQDPKDARVDVFGLLEATLDKAEPLPKARAARGE